MSLALKPRPSLEGQHFHVVVIGGGINGVAIARECARAGKTNPSGRAERFRLGRDQPFHAHHSWRPALLEHGELGLVRESVRERERLLRERSHWCIPFNFFSC